MSDAPALWIEEGFWPEHEALFERLMREVSWEHSMAARRTASFGVPYDYAQMSYPEKPMHPALAPVQDALEARLGFRFNNCLLNHYPDERSKMGFHADETKDLVPGTGVAIVSVGAERKISFRDRNKERHRSYVLPPGSLLYMEPEVQDEWVHAIKRRRRPAGPRVSLTWRSFVARSAGEGSSPRRPPRGLG